MKKNFISFRLDEDLHEFLWEYARSRRMTLTQVLVNLILEFYEKEKENTFHEENYIQTEEMSSAQALSEGNKREAIGE